MERVELGFESIEDAINDINLRWEFETSEKQNELIQLPLNQPVEIKNKWSDILNTSREILNNFKKSSSEVHTKCSAWFDNW